MTSARELIHLLVANLPELQASIYQLNRLLVVIDRHYHQILNKGLSLFDGLSDLQFSVGWIEEVVDVLHINLHEGNADAPLLLVLGVVEMVEDVVQRKWNEALIFSFDCLQSTHSKRFSRSCLSVHEQGSVVALEHVLDNGEAGSLENPLLRVGLIEHAIKVKLMDLILIVKGDSAIDDLQTLLGELVPHRPDPDIRLNLLLLTLSLRLLLLHYCNFI